MGEKLPLLRSEMASNKETALKKRAKHLFKREELRSQKTRLECLLTQQFIHKYGSKSHGSKLNDAIISLVKEYVNTSDGMHPDTLAELESKMKHVTLTIKDEVRRSRNPNLFITSSKDQQCLTEDVGYGDRNNESNDILEVRTKKSVNPCNWSIINAAMAISWDELEKKKQEDILKKREKYKYDLEIQRIQYQKVKELEKTVDDNYVKMNRLEAERREEEEKAQQENLKRKMEMERQLRMQQIKEKEIARNREKEMNLLRELSENARTLELMQQEEANKLILKEAKRRAQVEAKLENDRIRERKSEIKRIESEADVKIVQESIARSLLEEQRKSLELQKRFKSLHQNGKAFESQSAVKLDDGMKTEEQRLMQEMEKKFKVDDERERSRRDICRKEAIKNMHVNLQLMENKKLTKEKEKDTDKRLKLKYENDMKIMVNEQRIAMKEKFAKARSTREYLDTQVFMKSQSRLSESLLSQREIAFNKVLDLIF